MSLHCHHCGMEWNVSRVPGRQESCERCGADWRVCLNCAHHDAGVAHRCRERRAEPVMEKDRSNFCEWFEPNRDSRKAASGGSPGSAPSKLDELKRLLGG